MKTILTALAATFALAGTAIAAPVQWAGNGHYYEAIGVALNFDQSLAAADVASYLGETGYLATVTSADENFFIEALVAAQFGSPRSTFLGGSDVQNEGVWRWVAGPEIGQIFYGPGATPGAFAPWGGGEPNDSGGEDALSGYYFGGEGWNDICTCSGFPHVYGYVVEYGGEPGGIPEPAAWTLMIAGLGAAGAALRRRRVVAAA